MLRTTSAQNTGDKTQATKHRRKKAGSACLFCFSCSDYFEAAADAIAEADAEADAFLLACGLAEAEAAAEADAEAAGAAE